MGKSIPSLTFVFVFLMVLLGACAPSTVPAQPAPAHTVAPTTTLAPTNTFVPTTTSTKTPIPITATVPVPAKSLEYLTDVKIAKIETFDAPLSEATWYFGPGIHTTKGMLEIFGKDWTTLSPRQRLNEGEGVILDLNYSKGSIFEIYVSHGLTDTAEYKTVGIYIEKNSVLVNVWAAKNSLGGAYPSGNLSLQPDTTYSLLMAIIPNGEFLVVIWNPSDVSKAIYYHETIRKNWSNLTWDTGVAVDRGTLVLDNYIDIKFESIK